VVPVGAYIGAPIAVLLFDALYGLCFGLILVVLGAFISFSMVFVGAAHIAFGSLGRGSPSKPCRLLA
jgi:hypothetical protein